MLKQLKLYVLNITSFFHLRSLYITTRTAFRLQVQVVVQITGAL